MTKQVVYLDFITYIGGASYSLEGYFGGTHTNKIDSVQVVVGGKRHNLTLTHRTQRQEFLDLDNPIKDSTFSLVITLPREKAYIDFVGSKGRFVVKTNRFTRLSRLLYSSRKIGLHTFRLSRRLSVSPVERTVADELLTIASIVVNWRIPEVIRKIKLKRIGRGRGFAKEIVKAGLLVGEAIITIPVSIVLRVAARVTRRKYQVSIWLISDRSMAAGDNGEALFRYIMSKEDTSKSVYFVISKKSPDYKRIREIGPTIDFGSWKHKLILLHAEKLISSQADNETLNPYSRQVARVVDLLRYEFIFLQHGIIRHDLSGWLNRFNRNIALFITSSQTERRSILENDYYYTADQVILSGLPRYDYLENQPQGKIILAPTYRNNIVTKKTNKYGTRAYDAAFKESEYFKFYNEFMNDTRLLAAMKKYNMTGELYLHPVFEKQRSDFRQNDVFTVMQYPYDYKKAFREGNMLVSDHSSVVFDFAYLKKPVLYAHFDADTFFDGHSYDRSNFFDDEANGFGDVCPDYKTLVSKAVRLIESGCVMPNKYQKRVDNYFYKTDKHNSARVYRAIQQMRNTPADSK